MTPIKQCDVKAAELLLDMEGPISTAKLMLIVNEAVQAGYRLAVREQFTGLIEDLKKKFPGASV